MDWQGLYGTAVGVIGIAPSEFWKMTMWEYSAVVESLNKQNGGESLASKEEALAFYNQYGNAIRKKK